MKKARFLPGFFIIFRRELSRLTKIARMIRFVVVIKSFYNLFSDDNL